MLKRRNAVTAYFVAVITGFCIVLALALTAVEHVALDPARYEEAYARHQQAESIGMEPKELTRITSELLDYLRGSRESLDGTVSVNGVEREIYGEREKLHMVDVQRLFAAGFALRRWAVAFAAGGILVLVFLCRKYFARYFFRGYFAALGVLVLLGGLLAAAMSMDFSGVFVRFHLLFFDNDLWLLAPTDMLIMMFPEVFFYEMAVSILVRIGEYLLLPVCGWVAYRLMKKWMRRRTAHGATV